MSALRQQPAAARTAAQLTRRPSRIACGVVRCSAGECRCWQHRAGWQRRCCRRQCSRPPAEPVPPPPEAVLHCNTRWVIRWGPCPPTSLAAVTTKPLNLHVGGETTVTLPFSVDKAEALQASGRGRGWGKATHGGNALDDIA